ncbi:MAG: lipopolysaccharide heptosyltransferase I [Sedimentisphaerales bacterium]|nr:lipopolysaccharide heptosyltransferase I [Sedimentisphaerales bacterium]
MSEAFKNILIIKPSALGDIVQALPALSALRKSFPNAEISWLIRPQFAPLLENHPHLTHIIHFDRKFLGKAWFHPGAFAALLSLFRRLRHSEFDAVFDFQGLFRTAFLALVSGCKKRFGLADAQELSRIFYTHKVKKPIDSQHVVDYYIDLVRAAGAVCKDVEFTLPRDAPAEKSVERLLAANGINSRRYAVLVPGSAHSNKCWPVERFAELSAKLSAEHDLSVIASGSLSEAPLAQSLVESADVTVTNLAGRTSLTELIALLRNAALVVSNDTGPGHIAAALGRPLVMIFGRSNPARVGPYRRDNTVVAIDPKGRGHLPDSTNPIYDIRLITLDDVYQKVQMQINT